jgi:hypothetical protein
MELNTATTFFTFFKISTNVLYLLTTVTKTQHAPILMDLFSAVVIMDILGMERFARVKYCNITPK